MTVAILLALLMIAIGALAWLALDQWQVWRAYEAGRRRVWRQTP